MNPQDLIGSDGLPTRGGSVTALVPRQGVACGGTHPVTQTLGPNYVRCFRSQADLAAVLEYEEAFASGALAREAQQRRIPLNLGVGAASLVIAFGIVYMVVR